jgi:hypothetical protein
MTTPVPTRAKFMQADIDLTTATVKVGLLDTSTSYNFDAINDEFVSNLPTGAEPGDTSYARQTLTGLSVTEDSTDDDPHGRRQR